jgi:hypothetical protein
MEDFLGSTRIVVHDLAAVFAVFTDLNEDVTSRIAQIDLRVKIICDHFAALVIQLQHWIIAATVQAFTPAFELDELNVAIIVPD